MGEKEVIVKDFETLPKDIQRMVNDIPRDMIDANFELFLTVVRFVTRKALRRQEFIDKKKSPETNYNLSSDSMSMSCQSVLNNSPSQQPGSQEEISVSYSASFDLNSKGEYFEKESKTRSDNPNLTFDVAHKTLVGKEKATSVIKLVKRVGKGGFGRVYEAREKKGSKRKVAVKILPHLSQKERRTNYDEIYFVYSCHHPNILRYFSAYTKSYSMWMVTEFMDGGTLCDAVENCRFEEPEIAFVARELLQGVEYLHTRELIHRDLKSSNVMMTIGGDVKLIDFGLCCHTSYERRHTVGSPFWIPPEMIHKVQHGKPADIWSTGVCVLEMANGEPPYRSSAIKCMFMTAIGETHQLTGKWSDEFKDFVSKMLIFNPDDRWSASQLLRHPFLKNATSKADIADMLSRVFMAKTLQSTGGLGAV
eukprot:CAMPEP_0177648418 /NCGR_PEP_ID=MMETSP0447-20121125/10815_1 /TAXON_ID=0 /ORGANISM="Stygamoeba regulata, Strain BSH-02190019" /LENGTH=420 /DNA_ID=CAMNT_0019151053 /DNA_START=218 /DNA_END=1480 /DNA_ORIENTATION=+